MADNIPENIETKPIYKSKTVITNALAIILVYLLGAYGVEISTEEAVTFLSVVNILLRLITNTKIKLK